MENGVYQSKKKKREWSLINCLTLGFVFSSVGSSQTPWLLLPWEEDDDDKEERGLCFFNLDEKKEYRDVCLCREVYEGQCVGSSHGWLILLDKKVESQLLQPLFWCWDSSHTGFGVYLR